MDVTLIYGSITLALCIWAYARGGCGATIMGVTTFIFWFYSALVIHLTGDTLKQAMLASGDTLQAAILLGVVAYYKMPSLVKYGLWAAFSVMLVTHAAAIMNGSSIGMHYNTILDCAYSLQLLTLGGLMLRDEFSRNASNNRWHLHNPVHFDRRAR